MQARGSLLELETQIQIAENLGFLEIMKSEELKAKASNVGKMLNGLIESMVRKQAVSFPTLPKQPLTDDGERTTDDNFQIWQLPNPLFARYCWW